MEINYFPLFIICIVAWFVPFVLSWFEISKIPAVIVLIVMGVIIGPAALDLIPEEPYIDFLADTGFLFLIFLAGLEIDINNITATLPRGRIRSIDLFSNTLLLSIIIYFGSLILSFFFALLINQFIEISIPFFTILFPTVALSITVPILKADGELPRKFGQVMLMEGAIATIMSIILLAVYSGVLKNGFQVELLLFALIFVVFIITYYVGKRLIRLRTFSTLLYQLEHAASQIRVRGTVALLLLFVVVAAWIDTELIMGAFFAGMLLSIFVSKERSALLFKLDGMSYGFFIPIFFIMVGVDLEVSALSQFGDSIPFILTLLVGFFLTQVIPTLIMTKVFSLRKALSGGFLLTARLGLTIAAAQVAQSYQVISRAENAGIVTAAIITSLVSPLIYKLFSKEAESHYDMYILGGSKASVLLAERLKVHGVSFITILEEGLAMAQFRDKHLPYKEVDKLDENILKELNLRTSDLIIALTGSKTLNLFLSRYVKAELNHAKIITIVKTELNDVIESNSKFNIVDIDEVLAERVEDMIMRPDSISTIAESFKEYGIEEIQMTNEKLHRKLVRDIAFPQTGSLVIQRRGNEIFVPHGNTHLLVGDVITVIGNSDALVEFRSILH